MGGSRKANPGGMPGTAQLSGSGSGPTHGGDGGKQEQDDVLTVELINVDATVASNTKPGDAVVLRGIAVLVRQRRLGDLKPEDAEVARTGGFRRGTVYSVNAEDPWALVQLTA